MEKITISPHAPMLGLDASLEVSLLEHGFLFQESKYRLEDDVFDEYFLVYRVDMGHYDCGYIRETELDRIVFSEDWATPQDNERFLSWAGMTKDDWTKASFAVKFGQLFDYWGALNIMGNSYYTITTEKLILSLKQQGIL
jgi:hypothetical protein